MDPIRTIIVHPKDDNLQILLEIFEERGDTINHLTQLEELYSFDLDSANLILIDVSAFDADIRKIGESLLNKSPIFTDSRNLAEGGALTIEGDRKYVLLSPPYNRYQVEKAVIQNLENNKNVIAQAKDKKRLFRLPLRFKISLPYLLLTIGLGVFAAFILTRVIFDTIEDRFQNQLLEAGKITHEWLVNKESSMLETIRYIANIEAIDESIVQSDLNKLRDYIYPIAVNEELDSIRLLGEEGVQLIGMDHKKSGNIEEYDFWTNPEDFSEFPLVKRIIEQRTDDLGDKYSGFVQIYNKNILYITGPIFDDGGSLVGIVLVGEYIESLVNDMRTSTLTQVTIYDMTGAVTASSFELPTALDTGLLSSVLLNENDESLIRNFDVYDISYGEVLSPLVIRGREVIGILGNALTQSFLLYSTFITQMQIVVFVLSAILLVMIIGLLISRMVSAPLIELINASKAVANGDYSVSINSFSGDEIEDLANTFNTMVSAVRSSESEIIDAYDRVLDGWSRALELRDKETDYHCQRVADLTVKIAEKVGYPQDGLDNLRRGALLHDIGKMGIPDDILLKPAKLSKEEWDIMRKHPTFAMNLLKDIPFLHASFEIPYCHHERWDGSGYPNGLKGENIPWGARIFAIVDVWDAMCSDRPYRKALGEKEIFDYIMEEKGKHFDPAIVEAFLIAIRSIPR